jgi:hypothetical protein
MFSEMLSQEPGAFSFMRKNHLKRWFPFQVGTQKYRAVTCTEVVRLSYFGLTQGIESSTVGRELPQEGTRVTQSTTR